MTTFSPPRVTNFMQDIQTLDGPWYEMAIQIRDMHFKCNPNLVEDIKYGGLVFNQNNKLISGIFFRKAHISVEFGHGAALSDPNSVLEGKGKDRRHIKVRSPNDISAKNISYYVQQALAEGTSKP
ncbi:MAG: DUF1801 domain-containing protein [Algicola sp.]|nr:DUF1801 domain-containing protein [Algicola sp.]